MVFLSPLCPYLAEGATPDRLTTGRKILGRLFFFRRLFQAG
jgi:hypothetical protein